jgi:hypothetical protein
MLAWIPVLILSSLVDRNPANSSSAEEHLNQLVGGVRTELLSISDPERRRRLGGVCVLPIAQYQYSIWSKRQHGGIIGFNCDKLN